MFKECGIHITPSTESEVQIFTFKLPDETILLSKIISEKFGIFISALFKKFVQDMKSSVDSLKELELVLLASFLIHVRIFKNHFTTCNLNDEIDFRQQTLLCAPFVSFMMKRDLFWVDMTKRH